MSIVPPPFFERAAQLARSGRFDRIEQLRNRLRAEQYEQVDAHLAGALTRRQLLADMAAARKKSGSRH